MIEDKFIQQIIKECKKNKVPFNFYTEGWIAAITQILCAAAAIACLVGVTVLIGCGCR